VQIVNVDLATRHLDLLLTQMPERTAHETAGRRRGRRRR
jgi:hypothetical protein